MSYLLNVTVMQICSRPKKNGFFGDRATSPFKAPAKQITASGTMTPLLSLDSEKTETIDDWLFLAIKFQKVLLTSSEI